MQNLHELASEWGKDDSFAKACREAYADTQVKYGEVNTELSKLHIEIISNDI